MKPYQLLIAAHGVFWIGLAALSYVEISFEMGRWAVPALGLYMALGLPCLLILTWSVRVDAPVRLVKNYLTAFRWLGGLLWLTVLVIIWMASRIDVLR